ncbi:MAG TPA: SMP-30/gluconolactonase/LRE family protein [Ktedonobacteraceae bacterium]|jgi:sugar lactone lactonase YvrE|nr:SMP-30/gluconolactonase/LRE family protein [Ktedonobacteraceae bacterium]
MQTAQHYLTLHNQLGEGSFWNAHEQRLYWLDIKQQRFYRGDIGTDEHEYVDVGVEIGVTAPREAGGLVMATNKGFAFWHPQQPTLQFVANPFEGEENRRFNDGNIDAKGRFWVGTMCDPPNTCPDPVCKLYRLDPDSTVHMMDTGLGMPNGLVWSPDNTIMYLTDSPQQVIYQYDFDLESGVIANRRPFVQTHNEPGVPDGLTIDDQGFLWSVRYNGGKIIRYDPDGKVEREIRVPVPHPTSCAFAGPQLHDLYITTAWDGLNAEEQAQSPQSGDLFHIATGEITGPVRRSFRG